MTKATIISLLKRANLVGGLLFIFLFVFGIKSTAQVQSSKLDTLEVLQLIKLGKQFKYSEPEKSLQYFESAKQKSTALNYPHGAVISLIEAGSVYFGSNLDKTIDNGNEALSLFNQSNIQNEQLIAQIYMMLGEAHDEKGRKDSSAYYFYLLGQLLENNNNLKPEFELELYTKLTVFWIKMDYDSTYLKEVVTQYIEKARAAARKMPDTLDGNERMHFLEGLYYHALKQYEKARYYYFQFLEKRDANMSLPRRISVNANIAETYLLEKKPTQALEYLKKATAVAMGVQNQASMDFYLFVLNLMKAKALYQLKDYPQTIALINKTFEQVSNTNTPLQMEAIEAHGIIANAYEKTGEFEKALYHKNLYEKLHDSLMQKDKLDMVNQLEVRFRISEKDKELTRQKLNTAQAENQIRSKNFLLVSSGFALLLLSVVFGAWQYNSRNKQKLQQEKILSIQQSIEIEKLNAAISGEEKERTRIAHELHDGIGGILTAAKLSFEAARIRTPFVQSVEFTQGIVLLKEAAAELRNTAHHLMPEILLQGGLVEAVKYYCNHLVKNNQTEFVLQVLGEPQTFHPEFELSVYRIIQELLQNVLKHARAKNAIIQISYHDKDLAITVEDDGVGMINNNTLSGSGMGLTSIRERIKNLNGSMTISSDTKEGTSIYLEFEYPNTKTVLA